MTPFPLHLRPGLPIADQITYAARRAIVSGQMLPGDAFPSVRALSRDAHINPNTAHRVIAALLAEGLLELRSGVGTVVAAQQPTATARARRELIARAVEPLVVEARQLGLTHEDLAQAVEATWNRLTPKSARTGDDTE